MGGSRIFDWEGPRIDEAQDAGQNVLPEPNLIVYIGGFKKNFQPDPNPKDSFEGLKKCQKAPNLARLKNQKLGFTSKTKIDSLH